MSDEEYEAKVNDLSEALNYQHYQRIQQKAEHDDLLEKLFTLVTIAQAGLAKDKPHVTEYQLDRMWDMLEEKSCERIAQIAVKHERLHAKARSNMPKDYVINSALEESSNA
jgi:hypothetical protein